MSNEPSRATKRLERIALGYCAVLVLLFAIISYSAVITKSATYDEPLHATGAWMHLRHGDFRMNFEDPPLWKYVAAIPNGADALKVDFENNPAWKATTINAYQGFAFATNVLYQTPGNDGGAFVNRSRFMMMLIGVGLALVIIAFAWKLGGPLAGAIAATFFCLDPNALGHGPLVKNDISMSLVLCGAFMAMWYVGRRMTLLNAAALALITAAAVNTKFSALLMGPMIVLALGVRALLPMSWNVLGKELTKVAPRLLAAAALCIVIGFVSYVAIWACYGFRFNPTSDRSVVLNTVQHNLDAARYRFISTHPSPIPQPFDPGTPIDKLAARLAGLVQSVTKLTDEMLQNINGDRLSPYTRQLMASEYTQMKSRLDQVMEISRQATNFANNMPPSDQRADDFETQLLNISRNAHMAIQAMEADEYAGEMWEYIADKGDKAPDGFIKVLNVALDNKLLPSAWLHGVLLVHARSMVRGSYLLGQVRGTGWWYYFPLAMLFKTPVATLLALLGALTAGIAVLQMRSSQWKRYIWPLLCLTIPFAVYLLSVITANLNIGLRHVLPAYPFMYVAGAVLIGWCIRRIGNPAKYVAVALGAMLAIESLAVFPNYIAYFNWPSSLGGGGFNKLADSNLDWGQDLPALADWQKKHPDAPLAFGPAFTEVGGGSYFGTVDPAFYGIRATPLRFDYPPAITRSHVVAISATLLQGVYGAPYPTFRDREPTEVLNGTIYIYDLRLGGAR
jgi:hypothetical protein